MGEWKIILLVNSWLRLFMLLLLSMVCYVLSVVCVGVFNVWGIGCGMLVFE